MTNEGAELAQKYWVTQNVENHQILVLKMLFVEEQGVFHIYSHCISMDEDLTRTLLV